MCSPCARLLAVVALLPLAFGPSALAEPPYEVLTTEYAWLPGPGGARVRALATAPSEPGAYPVVVLVPGGIGPGLRLDRRVGRRLAGAGCVSVAFDAPGRGRSEGEEDYNGHAGQDALAAVIEWAKTLPQADPENVGVFTFSYGITMGAGCLARHPELGVRYLIDMEGPSSAGYICYPSGTRQTMDIWRDFVPPEEHPEFWAERQAVLFMPDLKCRYLRLQKQRDHVHGEEKGHAIELLNAATEAGVWTQCNGNEPNTLFDPERPEDYEWLDEIDELAAVERMVGLPPVGDQ